MIDKIKKIFKNRFCLLIFFALIFIIGNYFLTGNYLPTAETKNLWFYSGLFMVLFSILFIEPYYTSPKNVITNTIPLLLVFLSIKTDFKSEIIWSIAFWSVFILLVFSIIPLALNDENKSHEHWKNRIAIFLKKIVVIIGKGKIIYSAVFILLLYVDVISNSTGIFNSISDIYFIFLIILWGLILFIDPKELHNVFYTKDKNLCVGAIGEIFGVQSKKIFLVKLFEDRTSITKFEPVKFRYSMQDSSDYFITGIVFDTYLLNQEKWTKILQLGKINTKDENLEKNIVYKISDTKESQNFTTDLKIDAFVGIVIKGSKIGKIKFEYSKKQDDLQEGDLIELKIGKRKLFYQVVGGITEKEKLEAKNETGFIEGEATQLGEWQNKKFSFQKFGWLPTINTPVFKAETSKIIIPPYKYPDYKLGVIPNTELPSIINLDEAVSHHMALLGVTGSGKSFLAHEIIEQLQEDTKIICVDFTGEWRKKFKPLEIQTFDNIENAIKSNKISIIELDEVTNTTNSLIETNNKLQEIFLYAKTNKNCKKIFLILEEAHTIVPETTFLGDYGDYSANKALVNKMSQIALQGRKFNIGLLVIAQRTANVSKTVLTQCNTVICFQAFDETSINFLGNYIGKDLVQTLPDLKQHHAIVTGKAVKANIPMIVDLTKKMVENKIEKDKVKPKTPPTSQ